MAITNPKLFGLNVLSFLSDVENKNAALRSLDLNILDLDVIRGANNAGGQLGDWLSFSRLKQPIHKAIARYKEESSTYNTILGKKAGTDNILFGNLTINGALSGNAVRYRYIKGLNDPTASSRTIGFADISTSRVSSWSSFATPVIATSPISYGGRVGIKSEFSLKFEGTSSSTRLKTSITPTAREFASELPTSEITVLINGTPVKLYAMKGIPLVFRGFFRNFDSTIVINQIPGVAASWKVIETGNQNNFVNFADKGGITSSIQFRSSRSRERNIQFYYNPDNINQITIQSAGIDLLPVTVLNSLTRLDLRYNNLKNFPDFNFIAPSIKQILLSRNPFYLSETVSERKLNANIINKIPAGITELNLADSFNGSLDPNIFSKFTTLLTLFLGSDTSVKFYPDGENGNTPIPNVSDTCTNYSAYNNDFHSIANSSGNNKNIKELTNLSYLHISGCYNLTDSTFVNGLASDEITYVNIAATNLPFPVLQGKAKLEEFYGHYCRTSGGLFLGNTFKFGNCNALKTLYVTHTNLGGQRFPRFTNAALQTINFSFTNITGGLKDGAVTNDDFVIHKDTFKDCPSLLDFRVISGSLLTAPIDNAAFTFTPQLATIHYESNGRTTGSIPNFNSCTNLGSCNLKNNAFTTGTPNFQTSLNINYVNLSMNKLGGAIPTYKNLSNLTELYLNNNKFTAISKFINLPKLRYFYCHNQFIDGSPGISGEIPDFSSCPSMYYLVMYNNAFTSYKDGAFKSLYQLRYLDISNNNLSITALENIVEDLYSNYTETPRGGVTINLKNALQTGLSINDDILDIVTLLRAASWTVTLD